MAEQEFGNRREYLASIGDLALYMILEAPVFSREPAPLVPRGAEVPRGTEVPRGAGFSREPALSGAPAADARSLSGIPALSGAPALADTPADAPSEVPSGAPSGPDPSCRTPHSHPYYELFVCGRGSITLQGANGELILCAGDAMLIPAQYPHLMTAVSADAAWYSVGYACSHRQSHEGDALFCLVDGLSRTNLIRKYMNNMRVFEDVKALFGYPPGVSAYIPATRLFLVLAQLKATSSLDLEIDGEHSALHSKTELMSLLSYLDYFVYRRFAEAIPEAEIARQLFISERQLGRIATKRYGQSLHRAINEKRVTTAAEMLMDTDTDMTAEQIGRAVGFNSAPCFYREFSQKYGMTPAEYRKNRNANTK